MKAKPVKKTVKKPTVKVKTKIKSKDQKIPVFKSVYDVDDYFFGDEMGTTN